ncbi:MAG TPA: putative lipid II flippase FtsW [Planctomycetota bacterium]|nr:putative lipid II flippase FtsW [Planctomycetota bacterium]
MDDGSRDQGRLLAVVLALVSLGIVMVWSTTAVVRDAKVGDPTEFLRKQVLWTMLGAIAMALAWATDYHAILKWRKHAVGVVAIALVAVFATTPHKGARRWFDLGGAHIQPSELAKTASILYLVGHCAVRERLETLRGAIEGLGVLGLLVGLIALEPDLGTAALIAMTGALILLVAGVRLKHMFALGTPAAIVGILGGLTRHHAQNRLKGFLNPEADPLGVNYQIRQALIALGSGGPTGLGLGDSKQKLFFLPDDHTDFILAIIGEELGLVGTLCVLALFAALVVFGIRVAIRAKDREGFLLALGVTAIIGLQAAMNVAVVTASMPNKGISLPFISFGGSSLVVAMAGVGLLLNVASQSQCSMPSAQCPVPSETSPLDAEAALA